MSVILSRPSVRAVSDPSWGGMTASGPHSPEAGTNGDAVPIDDSNLTCLEGSRIVRVAVPLLRGHDHLHLNRSTRRLERRLGLACATEACGLSATEALASR